MAKSTVTVDEKLLKEAMKVAKARSKSDLVRIALQELIDSQKRRGMLALRGKVNREAELAAMREARF